MKSRRSLVTKLLSYFSLTLLCFTFILGGSFSLIYAQQLQQLHREELLQRAEIIAQTLGEYWQQPTTTTGSGPKKNNHRSVLTDNGFKVAGQSLNAYLQVIDQVALSDIWIIDQSGQLVTSKQSTTLAEKALPLESQAIIQQAFTGKTLTSDTFTADTFAPTITVATPVYAQTADPIAVVLLHTTVSSYQLALQESVPILLLSLTGAFIIAFIFAIFFTKRFVAPIRQMKQDVIQLGEGNYQVANKTSQTDELAQLQTTLSELATKLAHAQQEQAQFQTMRQQFMTNISHELRTPVTVIRGSLELLHDGIIRDDQQIRQYYAHMLHESIQLEHLLNDLLELSKLQTPEFQIQQQPVPLNDILMRVYRSMQPLMQQKQQHFQFDHTASPTVVLADEHRLEQFFKIFLTNAHKFTPSGGQISFIARDVSPTMVEVLISDNGIGIEAALLPHIFTRFSKSEQRENSEGSGLGLAIAQELALRHQIVVEITSEVGKGTLVRCQIPIVQQL